MNKDIKKIMGFTAVAAIGGYKMIEKGVKFLAKKIVEAEEHKAIADGAAKIAEDIKNMADDMKDDEIE